MRSGGGRVYLQCEECGRETRGWQLGKERPTSAATGLPFAAFQQLAHALWQRVVGIHQ